MSTGGFLLFALVVFAATMGSRLPWTRVGGLMWLGIGIFIGVASPSGAPWGRWHGFLPVWFFSGLAAGAFWWSMHREQESSVSRPSGIRDSLPSTEGKSDEIARDGTVLGTSIQDGFTGMRGRSVGVCLGILAVWLLAWKFPPPLPSVGSASPSQIGPSTAVPWFLAGLQEVAAWTTPWVGWILLPTVTLVALLAAPFVDTRDPELNVRFHGRSEEVPFFFLVWWFLGLLPILMATWLRPRGWLGPVDPPSASLSQRFWADWIGLPLPDFWLVRELPGLLSWVLLFVVIPWRLPGWKPTQGAFSRHHRRLGRFYFPAMILAMLLVWVLLAVLAGAVLGVGPWLVWGAAS